jgi:hypothetical protein
MKIDRISYSLTIESPGKWQKATWEAQLEKGDDPEVCYDELVSRVEAKLIPQGEPEGERVIQVNPDSFRARIENAKTRKDLVKLRPHLPQELNSYFLERQKQIIQSEKQVS